MLARVHGIHAFLLCAQGKVLVGFVVRARGWRTMNEQHAYDVVADGRMHAFTHALSRDVNIDQD